MTALFLLDVQYDAQFQKSKSLSLKSFLVVSLDIWSMSMQSFLPRKQEKKSLS
jgi:hypothetical protein